MANAKLQLEAKESAHKQALLKLDHYQKTTDELSTLLKNSDLKKNFYINESREATSRAAELESALEQMARQLSQSEELQSALQGELALLREAKAESASQMEGLLRQVAEMNETASCFKKEGADALAAKEAELESALSEAEERRGFMIKQLEAMADLENQLVEKSGCIDSLQAEVKELKMLSEKAASDAVSEVNRLREEMELLEKKSLDHEAEVEQIRSEVKEANEEANRLKMEMEKTKEEENEAQVEIALLKFELHKGRSKLAAAEAAEARAQSEKSALYNALQQLGLEAEETKRENRNLKEALKLADQETLIPSKEHEEEEKGDDGSGREMEEMRIELEAAVAKMGEMRARAEQATSRAEAAEKAKAALEEQNRRRREGRERRKVALEALREESVEREYESIKVDTSSKSYQPLGKVLNMKF